MAQAGDGSLPLCRESQARELQHLIDLHVGAGSGGAIYVCGIPGTGEHAAHHRHFLCNYGVTCITANFRRTTMPWDHGRN